MTLGDRCDEIVRLIDETLSSLGAEVVPGSGVLVDTGIHPALSALAVGGRPVRPDPRV